MANQKKTYFLCPTWDYHPDGPIQLGNIILSPNTPAESLNTLTRVPPTEGVFPPTTKTGVTFSSENLRYGCYGLWTEFLSLVAGIGVDAVVSHDSRAEEAYAFDAIDTTEFLPTPEYLTRSVAASPAVTSFLEKSRFRKHVYMITALKVARGARARSALSRSLGAKLKIGLDSTLVSTPMNFGPEVSGEWGGGESSAFDASSDFVFAFRLRKVVVRRSGEITHVEYTKRAMYDAVGHPVEPQGLPFVVEGLAEQDASAQEFGCIITSEVTDEGEECLCVRTEEE